MSLALSESLKQDKFLEPPKKLVSSREKRRKVEYEDEEEDDDEDEQYDLAGRTQRRRANVYDAVAGKILLSPLGATISSLQI